MRLHSMPRSRAVRARWLLEELGVPYELVPAQSHAEVPVLEDGALRLFDSSAIVLYLADKYAEHGFCPALDAPERGAYYQWLLYAEGPLEAAVAQGASPALDHALGLIATELGDRRHIAGATFTAADLVLASVLHRAYSMKLLDGHPTLVAYAHHHASRPAVRRALS